ncbi:MAG: FdrA family protein [Sporichthyaceae bacterium]
MASPSTSVEIRHGAYHDSVTLMQVSRSVSTVDGVRAALIAMATELNLDLLDGMGFPAPDGAGPNDLLVAIRADDAEAVARGKAELDAALARSSAGGSGSGGLGAAPPPRTTGSAARRTGANLALVSVPGAHAFSEAMDALEAGLNVMLFSDNVPVEQEIRLKDEGAKRGLLVMGPDCGTAAVAGVGLGFANTVRPGAVGIVAASGTGAQQLMCLLDAAGVGLSHCLGVGGRDLSAAVGGRSTRQALAMLAADPATELVIVVSKPPAKEVADQISAYAEGLATPVQLAFLGAGRPDLTAAARRAVATVGGSWPQLQTWTPTPAPAPAAGSLRGLFAGGTLCDEAMVIAAQELGPIRSNIPLQPDWELPGDLTAEGHTMIDFGDDRLTQGRAHPMIDQRSRLERVAAETKDPRTAVLLLDVVLGYGAHPDPASELAPALADSIRTARADGRSLAVVVSLCGTEGDPQGLARQGDALAAAGAVVHRSNADAARAAAALTRETG